MRAPGPGAPPFAFGAVCAEFIFATTFRPLVDLGFLFLVFIFVLFLFLVYVVLFISILLDRPYFEFIVHFFSEIFVFPFFLFYLERSGSFRFFDSQQSCSCCFEIFCF